MAVLKLGVPLPTRESQLLVENRLPVGRYLFQLEVVDDDGNRSEPAHVVVTVVEATQTTITSIDPLQPIRLSPLESPTVLSPLRITPP